MSLYYDADTEYSIVTRYLLFYIKYDEIHFVVSVAS